MSIERSIVNRLFESRLSDSFTYNGYKYWRYNDICYKCKVDSTGDDKEEIDSEEYSDIKSRRNTPISKEYKDLDDETIHDIKRMSHALVKIEDDEELSPEDKARYSYIVSSYIGMSQENNIPISDYKHTRGKSRKYMSELKYILLKYTPPLPKSRNPLSNQTFDPVDRKYK